MRKITVNLSYYNQKDVLIRHVQSWLDYDEETRDKFSFCIVDDCSEVSAIDVLSEIDLSGIKIDIYRVEEDLCCNIAGVRNLAATVCQTDWMVILDMDTMISNDLASKMLKLISESGKGDCFKFNRRALGSDREKDNQIHPAVCLIRVDDYWAIGGCDEDLVGHYGQTDPIFWHRARGKLKNVHTMSHLYLDYIPEGSALINRDTSHNEALFRKKIIDNSWSSNYLRFKWRKEEIL